MLLLHNEGIHLNFCCHHDLNSMSTCTRMLTRIQCIYISSAKIEMVSDLSARDIAVQQSETGHNFKFQNKYRYFTKSSGSDYATRTIVKYSMSISYSK
jgi:hypothetical protein